MGRWRFVRNPWLLEADLPLKASLTFADVPATVKSGTLVLVIERERTTAKVLLRNVAIVPGRR